MSASIDQPLTDGERGRLAALEAEVARLREDVAKLLLWQKTLEDGVRELLAKPR